MDLITQVFKGSKRLGRFPLFRFMDGISATVYIGVDGFGSI